MGTIAISNIRKSYGQNEVVHGVDLGIEDGEFVVIVGPSGCGKTTLLRMIAGLEEISGGTLTIDGEVMNDIAPAARGCAMVFQNYALYPHMSVEQNMAYPLKIARMPKAERDRRVKEAAAILALDPYLERRPGQLSGGQRQRVAMGRAIVREPKVFLFDEPLSNLDAELRVRMRLEIRRLHKRLGATSVFVTHDQVEAMTLADKLVVMYGGKIEQVGTPSEVYRRPATTFVAGFLGAPAMNLLPAVIDGRGDIAAEGAPPLRISARSLGVEAPAGTQLVLGMRPEDGHVLESGRGAQARIELIEDLGGSRIAHCLAGETEIAVVLARDSRAAEGDEVVLAWHTDAMHVFDRKTGSRWTAAAAGAANVSGRMHAVA